MALVIGAGLPNKPPILLAETSFVSFYFWLVPPKRGEIFDGSEANVNLLVDSYFFYWLLKLNGPYVFCPSAFELSRFKLFVF